MRARAYGQFMMQPSTLLWGFERIHFHSILGVVFLVARVFGRAYVPIMMARLFHGEVAGFARFLPRVIRRRRGGYTHSHAWP